jgi:hypothetical protein
MECIDDVMIANSAGGVYGKGSWGKFSSIYPCGKMHATLIR